MDLFGDQFDDFADYTKLASEDVIKSVGGRVNYIKYQIKEKAEELIQMQQFQSHTHLASDAEQAESELDGSRVPTEPLLLKVPSSSTEHL